MPEGHTVHRIALQFTADFVGRRVAVSSPQGRFAAGAALLDGLTVTSATAVGKHLFLGFDEDSPTPRWLHVHLGLIGAWDLHGQVSPLAPDVAPVGHLGAPRARRAVRMGERERDLAESAGGPFPPPPIGQVRVRLATARTVADLRGPMVCAVITSAEKATVTSAIGPDPFADPGPEAEQVFVDRLTGRRTAVGVLLLDQSIGAGIGNIYRAELLFRAGLDPRTPGHEVPEDVARRLWQDWAVLLADGIRTGEMITRADLDEAQREAALTDESLRHAVYGRADQPCLRCGVTVVVEEIAGRKLFWCPGCQVRPGAAGRVGR